MAAYCIDCKHKLTDENAWKRGDYFVGRCKNCERKRAFLMRWSNRPIEERMAKLKSLQEKVRIMKQHLI